jgi:hypothetical protein
LFGRVLDASDTVLHEPRTDAPEIVVSALSAEFESNPHSIYSRSRTLDEVTREITALRDKISKRRDAYEKEYERTSQIIESRFDENVRMVFKRLRADLPDGLADFDRDLADLVDGYLTGRAIPYGRSDEAGRVVFDVAPCGALPSEVGDGSRFATGDARSLTDAQALNLRHPLVRAAIADARSWSGGGSVVLMLPPNPSPDLVGLAGKVGLICVVLLDYLGSSRSSRLIAAAVIDGTPLHPSLPRKSCACAQLIVRHPRFQSTHNGSMTRSMRPCSSTSAGSSKASRGTSSEPSVNLSGSSKTKFSCVVVSEYL